MGDTRFPIGSLVDAAGRLAEVRRHGRDMAGVYTEVRYNDGSEERLHRSSIRHHVHAADGSCDCHYWSRAEWPSVHK